MRHPLSLLIIIGLFWSIAGCSSSSEGPRVDYSGRLDGEKLFTRPGRPFKEEKLPENVRAFLEIDWQLPIPLDTGGKIVNAWNEYDLLLIETRIESKYEENFNLMAIERNNGTMIWVVGLKAPIQYRPTVTRGAVYVISDDELVSIERVSGLVRWVISPADFSFGTRPLVVEPPTYPPEMEMNKNYDMEKVFVGSLDGKLHALQVVGRMQLLSPGVPGQAKLSHPIIDPLYSFRRLWFKVTKSDILWEPVLYRNNIYFVSTDSYMYCVGFDGTDRYKRRVQAPIRSPIRASNESIYFAGQDSFFYSMISGENTQKWVHPLQGMVTREIFIDHHDPLNQLIYVPVRPLALAPEDPSKRARIICIRHEEIKEIVDEDAEIDLTARPVEEHTTIWEVKDAMEVVGIGREVVYLGGSSLLPGRDYDSVPLDVIMGIEKSSGLELWWSTLPRNIIRMLVPFDQKVDMDRGLLRTEPRIVMITQTNHILCFVEPSTESGPYELPGSMQPESDTLDPLAEN